MVGSRVKLRLSKSQEDLLDRWFWHLTGVWNWAVRKIELDARDGIYYSQFEFQNILAGTSKKLGLPSHTIQHVLAGVWTAWDRCFKRKSMKPRFKGTRNRLSSAYIGVGRP